MQKAKKIIVADDDPAILDAIRLMLEFEGYDVECYPNGNGLLNMAEEMPDLLLLDIWMSGTDGRDLCQQLKQQDSTRDIPVIMISASHDIESSARAAGADDFLAKPFDINELLDKIEKNIAAN